MANSEKIAFYEKYAPLAMEQQQKYGIPASVTLAQAWWERGAANSLNNFFGIKADSSWVRSGKPYGEFKDDDSGLSKFRKYQFVSDSFEDHSRFLLQNNRYSSAYSCESNDYSGWLQGLKTGGYSTNSRYIYNLEKEIKDYDLYKYDQMAILDARSRGITIGYCRNASSASTSPAIRPSYVFPIKGDLVVTDLFNVNSTSYRDHAHNGIDLRANYVEVQSTEDNGKIVSVGQNQSAGKYVIVEYDRGDGGKTQVSYCHLFEISVRKGDDVSAGVKLGISGMTGNCTAPHLHLTVKQCDKGSSDYKTVNPLSYLAELSVKGNLSNTVSAKGQDGDLLSDFRNSYIQQQNYAEVHNANQQGSVDLSATQLSNINQWQQYKNMGNDPNGILQYLMSQNKEASLSSSGNLFGGLISSLFTAAIALAVQLDHTPENCNTNIERDNGEPDIQSSSVIHRSRESVDPVQASRLASMNYESERANQSQSATQQISLS